MTIPTLNAFVQGGCAMACATIGLFFFRYWRSSHDRLFLFFLAGFWAFAVNWVGGAVITTSDETRHWMYVLRLAAFLSIAIGIIDKNRRNAAR